MRVELQPATLADLHPAEDLLRAANLPPARLERQFPQGFFVFREAEKVVAVAGVETYGRFGLLRSVAVAEEFRGRGLGATLVRACLGANAELDAIYLLTTSDRAATWFESFGFSRTPRPSAPPEVQASEEFATACPGNAICLVRAREARDAQATL